MAFLYADKIQQLIRANRFLVIGYVVYYAYVMLMLLASLLRGERSPGYCGMIGTLVLISLAVILIIFKVNKASPKLRYVSLVGLCLISWIIGYAYTQDFARIIGCFPLIGCILFFDLKFSIMSSVVYVLAISSISFVQIFADGQMKFDSAIDEVFVTSAVVLLLTLVVFTTRIASMFNNHSVGAALAEQERQKEIMDDVLTVASEVRKGTEKAMEMINQVNESSEVVNTAMKDISDSTYSTSESIQTQTTMTQNIQESLQVTIESSENMVRVAQQSNELNQQNLVLML